MRKLALSLHVMASRGLAALVLLYSALPATAQEKYPNRPIDFIVTWGTGGGADSMARQISALAQVLNAKPDGYTIVTYIQDTLMTNRADASSVAASHACSPSLAPWVSRDMRTTTRVGSGTRRSSSSAVRSTPATGTRDLGHRRRVDGQVRLPRDRWRWARRRARGNVGPVPAAAVP